MFVCVRCVVCVLCGVVCGCVSVGVCMCVYVCLCVFMCVYVCVCVCIMCVCVYVYVCALYVCECMLVCVCMYIHTHIHSYTSIGQCLRLSVDLRSYCVEQGRHRGVDSRHWGVDFPNQEGRLFDVDRHRGQCSDINSWHQSIDCRPKLPTTVIPFLWCGKLLGLQ